MTNTHVDGMALPCFFCRRVYLTDNLKGVVVDKPFILLLVRVKPNLMIWVKVAEGASREIHQQNGGGGAADPVREHCTKHYSCRESSDSSRKPWQ